jgi:long-chain-fatty-acid--CoA ligase ACSBG
MISHDNILFEARCVLDVLSETKNKIFTTEEEERIISYLPLSHVAGMMVDIVVPICASAACKGWCSASFARPYDLSKFTFGERLRIIKPTIFLGVPRVWEKIAEKIKKAGAKVKGALRKVANWAKAKGMAHQGAIQLAGPPNKYEGAGTGSYPSLYGLAEKVVLNKVKKQLGLECCKYGFTGAAPIGVDTLEFFGALGININEVYGMSECTGATTWSTDESHVWGSCGWALPGTEVSVRKVDEKDNNKHTECPTAEDIFAAELPEENQGEICFRGRHIMMGYMANPDLGAEHVEEIQKKTADAIDDQGWLHSGDKGAMDSRGMFRITGRYKELIIGAGGENIAPVPIENAFKAHCQGVTNIMMVGDKKKYNTALVCLETEGATGEAPGNGKLTGQALAASKEMGSTATTTKEAQACAKWKAHIEASRAAVNGNAKVCISNACAIQKISILEFDFSVQTEELTPTLKLKRSTVMSKNKDIIDAMY